MSTPEIPKTPAPPRPSLLARFGRQAVETWKAQDKTGADDRSGYHSTPAPQLRK